MLSHDPNYNYDSDEEGGATEEESMEESMDMDEFNEKLVCG